MGMILDTKLSKLFFILHIIYGIIVYSQDYNKSF